MSERSRDRRIAIIGAGAAGLSAAHFLGQHGYHRVTVFEKLGRVGGLCSTITVRNKPFDLGGNYITPAYRETRKLARRVRARRIRAHPYIGARIEGDRLAYHEIFDLIRQDPDDPGSRGRRVPFLALARAMLRFGWLRWKLRSLIDQPTLERLDEHPELCVSFDQWLAKNDLLAMRGLFQVPVTTFGYGFLDEIPAPYVLKYMHPLTYLAMAMRGIPVIGRWVPWPQRFADGFQRLWERLASGLDVRLDVEIKEITRDGPGPHPVRIRLERWEQVMNDQQLRREELFFDELILACPLTLQVLRGLALDLSQEEIDLFAKVETHSYCQTLLHCVDEQGKDLLLKAPVVILFPFNRETIGKPWAVVQYWGAESPMIQLYTRLSHGSGHEVGEETVEEAERKLLARMGARVAPDRDRSEARYHICWPYFPHVGADDMAKGFFRRLEQQQGQNHTFYAGSATNFELIEPIVQYSKHLVEKHFAGSASG